MKKQSILLSVLIVAMFSFYACNGEKQQTNDTQVASVEQPSSQETAMSEFDLSDRGIPIKVKAPVNVEIKKGMGAGEMDGAKIYSCLLQKDKFRLEIDMWDAQIENTVPELIQDHKDIVIEDEGFEIVKEEENGFIYKTKNEDGDNFNFYYVKMKDQKAIEFGSGLNFSNYTLEQIETLYEAAKNAL